jgi:NitT/TauT family transport system permease protein
MFVVWEILAQRGKLSAIIFPAPSLFLTTFFNSLLAGEYLADTLISLKRLIAGFMLGGSSGLLLGLVMGWSKRVRNIFDPIIAAIHPVPKFALLPMVIIFFGIGNASKIAMVSIASFFPMLINTMAGVLQINPTYYDVVENYGATRFDVLKTVILPGSLPLVMTGARLSLKAALTITVGVEMVFGNTGLGSQLWLAWETMRMINLYSILLIVSFIGFASNFILEKSKKLLLPWHQEVRSSD